MIEYTDKVLKIIDDVENGNIETLKAGVALKNLQNDLEALSKTISAWMKENLSELAESAREYDNEFGGYRFEYRNGAKRWNFKNVPQWVAIEKDKKNLESQLKTAWEASQKGLVTGTIEGEEVILPEVKYSDDVLIWRKS